MSRPPFPANFERVMRFPCLAILLTAALRLSADDVACKLTDQNGAPVADAVVSLQRLDAPEPAIAPAGTTAEISQQDKEFIPYVTAIQVGTTIHFPNRDKVQHHVYSLSKAKKFELPLYSGEDKGGILFDQPGVVTISCNIHDWMIAYIVVLPTPHFVKTGPNGAATLSVPAGHYHLEIWQPRLAQPLTEEITVVNPTPTSLAFTLVLKPDHRIPRPPDNDEDNPY
ncbi:MAG TPA: methylamine utilization protein [Opitutaceae bacterium]|nr:methylamine utilization protein [Opitutaceae bacterium]